MRPLAQRLIQGLTCKSRFRQGGTDLLFHRLHRRGAIGGDRFGGLQGPRQERLAGDDPVDESDLCGGGGVDQVGGQEELHGMHVADLLDEFDGPPPKG